MCKVENVKKGVVSGYNVGAITCTHVKGQSFSEEVRINCVFIMLSGNLFFVSYLFFVCR